MRLEAVGKRYGMRQPWVVRGVTAELPAGRLIRVSGRECLLHMARVHVLRAGEARHRVGQWLDRNGR